MTEEIFEDGELFNAARSGDVDKLISLLDKDPEKLNARMKPLADAGGDVVGRGDDHELEVIGLTTCWARFFERTELVRTLEATER